MSFHQPSLALVHPSEIMRLREENSHLKQQVFILNAMAAKLRQELNVANARNVRNGMQQQEKWQKAGTSDQRFAAMYENMCYGLQNQTMQNEQREAPTPSAHEALRVRAGEVVWELGTMKNELFSMKATVLTANNLTQLELHSHTKICKLLGEIAKSSGNRSMQLKEAGVRFCSLREEHESTVAKLNEAHKQLKHTEHRFITNQAYLRAQNGTAIHLTNKCRAKDRELGELRCKLDQESTSAQEELAECKTAIQYAIMSLHGVTKEHCDFRDKVGSAFAAVGVLKQELSAVRNMAVAANSVTTLNLENCQAYLTTVATAIFKAWDNRSAEFEELHKKYTETQEEFEGVKQTFQLEKSVAAGLNAHNHVLMKELKIIKEQKDKMTQKIRDLLPDCV